MVEEIFEGERMITDVCIVGGGPAGMMTGLLLAKQGLDVVVLERNPDFHREYRGEIHQPRFVQLMKELNLDEYIMKDVQLTINELKVFHENSEILHVPFDPFLEEDSHIIRLPQPTFLTALLQKASFFPNFKLLFNTAVKDLMFEGEKVIGVIAQSNDDMLPSQFKIKAAVTIGADGRNSIVAKKANFKLERDYYMNDLMWLIAEKPKFLGDDLYHFYFQKNFNYLFLSRLDGLIQYGISLERGEFNRIKEQGLDAFKQKILEDMPMLQPALDKVTDFKSFIPLNCKMIYVKEWAKEGCLVIGDAAHCMTPWGGVGTSLALGTAITAADIPCPD